MRHRIECTIAIAMLSATMRLPAAVTGATMPAWQTDAWLHRTMDLAKPFARPRTGSLSINSDGIDFHSRQLSHRWTLLEIHTFDISGRDFTVTVYESRHWHEPGERRLRFTLRDPMPPRVASALAKQLGRPVRNGVPDSSLPAFATIPVYHRVHFGGTNGLLRLTSEGLEYITSGADARSWRWIDLNTISSPDAYHLQVFGYLDTYRFELKEPITRKLLNRVVDQIFAHHLLDEAAGYAKEYEQP